MITKSQALLRLFATAAGVAVATAAIAQGGTVQLPASNTYTGTTTVSAKTKSSYKKATWTTYQASLTSGSTSREIPPTDCPPLPVQVCIDSWDDELTTAKPSN